MFPKLSQHKLYEQAVDFLKGTSFHPGIANSTFFYGGEGGETPEMVRGGMCHTAFAPEFPNNSNVLIANAIAANKYQENEAAQDVIKWFFCPDKSPWRQLIKDKENYELIFDKDGDIKGVIFHPYILQSFHWWFVRNFCVALRFTQEYHGQLRAWEKIRQAGYDPRDAYILVRQLNTTADDEFSLYYRYGGHDGLHWPLNSTDGGRGFEFLFSWDKYWNGKISFPDVVEYKGGSRYNRLFLDVKGVQLFKNEGQDMSDVFDRYNNWKVQNNLKEFENE